VKLQPKEGPCAPAPGNNTALESFHDSPAPRISNAQPQPAPVSAAVESADSITQTETAIAEDEPLKIYYPQEIREKTMVEVKDNEFQDMMANDSALKELVEKTKRIFGVDDKCVKFHRSTLA